MWQEMIYDEKSNFYSKIDYYSCWFLLEVLVKEEKLRKTIENGICGKND